MTLCIAGAWLVALVVIVAIFHQARKWDRTHGLG